MKAPRREDLPPHQELSGAAETLDTVLVSDEESIPRYELLSAGAAGAGDDTEAERSGSLLSETKQG